MRTINASETGTLVLGFQGEDQRLEIRFPLVDEKTGRNLTEEFPGGNFSISIMLPGDPEEHIVGSEDFRIDGNYLIWTVKEAYTTGFGEGKLQLNYAFGGMAKSRIWKTSVRKSIGTGDGTVPDWSDWKTELLNAANQVQQAVDSYDEMTAEAEELPAGSTPTARIDRTGDHPVLVIGMAEQGGGGGGADIDDEHTRTDRTWSSKKISDELAEKYTKPQTGIPASDMSQAVKTSLEKADTAIQEHQDISGKLNKPDTAGTAGQVLGLDGNLNPVWKTPYPQNYELIADLTLTEDTDDLVINKFSDNSQLLITDFILQCDFKAAPSSSYLGAIWKDANNVTQYMPTGQMLTDSDKTAYYWTERFGNMVRMFANRPYEWDATTYDQPYYYNMFYDSPTIREVNLYKYSISAQPIPAGSRIRLWGVRA